MEYIRPLSALQLEEINKLKYSATRRFGDDYVTSPLGLSALLDSVRGAWATGLWRSEILAAVCYGEGIGGDAHIEFLGVALEFQRRRYGIRLMENFITVAAAREMERVTLITSGSAPWNQPYYEALGFRAIEADRSIPDYLASRLKSQTESMSKFPLLLPRVAMERVIELDPVFLDTEERGGELRR